MVLYVSLYREVRTDLIGLASGACNGEYRAPLHGSSSLLVSNARDALQAPKRHRWYCGEMKGPDLDRERSEQKRSRAGFLVLYNEGLPAGFPRATDALLVAYHERYPEQFAGGFWSLDLHRKKLMDWRPGYLKSLEPRSHIPTTRATIGLSTSAEPVESGSSLFSSHCIDT